MFLAGALTHLVFRGFPGDGAQTVGLDTIDFTEDLMLGTKPSHIQMEPEQDGEELSKMLFPVQVSDETLRLKGACRAIETRLTFEVRGEYVFTLREWRRIREWFAILISGEEEDLDGRRLLRVGRSRWEDEAQSRVARTNAATHTELWLGHGMWPQ